MLALAASRVESTERVPCPNSEPLRIVNGVLRKGLGFHGVVITDALNMRGLTRLYTGEADPSGRIAVDAVKAGDDVLMVPGNVDAAYITQYWPP